MIIICVHPLWGSHTGRMATGVDALAANLEGGCGTCLPVPAPCRRSSEAIANFGAAGVRPQWKRRLGMGPVAMALPERHGPGGPGPGVGT
jgi:hypothetical protein